jgi:transcriptional regulator NrdR family protein
MNDLQRKDINVPDDRGLRCRKCGQRRFRVIYTRPRFGGIVIRRRACLHCGTRFTTWERAIG